jgi:hypothetical protein
MIPEYKLYHGAVLAEIVHELTFPVKIDELQEQGRLSSYVLESRIGLHVKHSSKRLHPWSFTFTQQNLLELKLLSDIFPEVFIVFVCHTDGMICCAYSDFSMLVGAGLVETPWIRADRRKNKWFQLSGPATEEPTKYPNGIESLLEAIKRVPI